MSTRIAGNDSRERESMRSRPRRVTKTRPRWLLCVQERGESCHLLLMLVPFLRQSRA